MVTKQGCDTCSLFLLRMCSGSKYIDSYEYNSNEIIDRWLGRNYSNDELLILVFLYSVTSVSTT